MNRAQLAMAYQACEVADLATAAATLHDPAEATAQAARVLAAARQLVAAADRLTSQEPPTDPLQRFAYEHPDEAAADLAHWLGEDSCPIRD
ncbi:hypothetical protein [Kribbella sp. NPDC004875]|uniref:hypothetical protein n=1 Tax=Kribbella sp. NPDC004875 TaxID=3364107 RepID=UPI0036B71746